MNIIPSPINKIRPLQKHKMDKCAESNQKKINHIHYFQQRIWYIHGTNDGKTEKNSGISNHKKPLRF